MRRDLERVNNDDGPEDVNKLAVELEPDVFERWREGPAGAVEIVGGPGIRLKNDLSVGINPELSKADGG